MNTPTLWEEGRWSGTRVTRFSVFASLLLAAADLVATGRLERVFDAGFILLCIAMALAIRPSDFFRVGVLPPMLLLGLSVLLGVVDRGAIASRDSGLIGSIISGLATHSGPLSAGYVLALTVLGIRARVLRRHQVEEPPDYSNLAASPAP